MLKLEIAEREETRCSDAELETSLLQAPQQRVQSPLERLGDGEQADAFDPYALFEALERHRVSYVVIGGFARVVHGSGELTRGLDIVPSLREDNLRHLAGALEDLGAPRAAAELSRRPNWPRASR